MTAAQSDVAAGPVGTGAVTLVEGSSFCISSANGDMAAGHPHGVFFRDMRILSRWNLYVDDEPAEPLTSLTPEPFRATFLARAHHRWAHAESTLLVRRERRVGTGLREDIVLQNLGREAAGCTVSLLVGADFADLFEVKENRTQSHGDHSVHASGTRISVDYRWRDLQRGVVVEAPDATSVSRDGVVFRIVVPPHAEWSTTVFARPVVDGHEMETRFPIDQPVEESEPARRMAQWRRSAPIASADDENLEHVLRRTERDLGALRIFDPEHRGRAVIAAGAPWFMALFGRDSLLTSYMSLPIGQSLALGTLQTLALYQGRHDDPLTEEQPGRILHEVRLGVDTGLALGGGGVYYGTADATPLFVLLVGELHRWGLPREDLEPLLPHVDRALDGVQHSGDRDGDGFVEYQRATDRGLANQGWKDSWDGVNFADGRLAEAPIALCEVQGYVYAAYLARARIAAERGDRPGHEQWSGRAAKLKQTFNERVWLPDRGYYAIALDRDKRPVDACTSNMGHCLWTGIVDEDKAGQVADRLLSEEMFTGWGVRTLASDMGAYNPVSYHNGSVWPHDSTLVAAGLMRYGFVEHAQRIATGLLDAARQFDGRLPELFCGFGKHQYPVIVPYPTSCSPQAWASAAPLHLMRVLLRFDPEIPDGTVWLAPALPDGFGRLQVRDVPLAGARVSVDVPGDDWTVDGLPEGIELRREPAGLPAP
jgi:glycogen debranching enzyme